MEDVPNPRLVDGRGDPVAPRIEMALTRLLPQGLRRRRAGPRSMRTPQERILGPRA